MRSPFLAFPLVPSTTLFISAAKHRVAYDCQRSWLPGKSRHLASAESHICRGLENTAHYCVSFVFAPSFNLPDRLRVFCPCYSCELSREAEHAFLFRGPDWSRNIYICFIILLMRSRKLSSQPWASLTCRMRLNATRQSNSLAFHLSSFHSAVLLPNCSPGTVFCPFIQCARCHALLCAWPLPDISLTESATATSKTSPVALMAGYICMIETYLRQQPVT